MVLRINVKPNEAVYIGLTRITLVSQGNVTLLIERDAPVLREKDVIAPPPPEAHAARLQYLIQQMYLGGGVAGFNEEYFALARAMSDEGGDRAEHIARTNFHLARGEFYKALKLARLFAQTTSGDPAEAPSRRQAG